MRLTKTYKVDGYTEADVNLASDLAIREGCLVYKKLEEIMKKKKGSLEGWLN